MRRVTSDEPLQAVHQALAHYARDTPDAIFLVADGGVSYRRSASWVGAVATRYLAGLAGERMAIWMAKGNNYALSVLAVLSANGVYVPLDGSQPVARAAGIIQDAAPKVLMLDSTHYAELITAGIPDSVERVLLLGCADQDAIECDGASILHLASESLYDETVEPPGETDFCPDQVAAILYTSGSTGKPKGVQLSHLNLANFIQWCGRELSLTPGDVFLNIASFNFDLSTFDLFCSLRHGAALYVTDEFEQQSIARLAEILKIHHVSVLYTVPSLLALMTRARVWEGIQPLPLRYVLFAGEVMPISQLKALAKQLPGDCRLYNFYGPTETNVCRTTKSCKPIWPARCRCRSGGLLREPKCGCRTRTVAGFRRTQDKRISWKKSGCPVLV